MELRKGGIRRKTQGFLTNLPKVTAATTDDIYATKQHEEPDASHLGCKQGSAVSGSPGWTLNASATFTLHHKVNNKNVKIVNYIEC